jgi:hypothetical protein
MKYNGSTKNIEICSINQYTGERECNSGPAHLNLVAGEYIAQMAGNSQWWEVKIRTKGQLSSPRRVFGSSTFDKLPPAEAKPMADASKDYYIFGVQNSQISISKFSRAGFFGLSLINRENVQIGIYSAYDFYLTIKKDDKPNEPEKDENGVEIPIENQQNFNQQPSPQKSVTIRFTDKTDKNKIEITLNYEFVDSWYPQEFSRDYDG